MTAPRIEPRADGHTVMPIGQDGNQIGDERDRYHEAVRPTGSDVGTDVVQYLEAT